ncbi:hypothetical protein [Sanguibacter gelidistatuariae]|uniref:hypothetical protein n=1 Tax=Sanguibacter gelidistatuariae TaxID=1814289 RepID=UPI0015880B90|nr:hypothetical protein [Sanguibacter gelidistatuariae]
MSAEQAQIVYTRLLTAIQGNAKLRDRFERLADEAHLMKAALWSDLVNGVVAGITTAGDDQSDLLKTSTRRSTGAPASGTGSSSGRRPRRRSPTTRTPRRHSQAELVQLRPDGTFKEDAAQACGIQNETVTSDRQTNRRTKTTQSDPPRHHAETRRAFPRSSR